MITGHIAICVAIGLMILLGPPYCHFDIITGLGAVTIYGNWMRTFTLRRYGDEDMLPGFCNTKELNIDYWAEKLDMKKQAKDAAG